MALLTRPPGWAVKKWSDASGAELAELARGLAERGWPIGEPELGLWRDHADHADHAEEAEWRSGVPTRDPVEWVKAVELKERWMSKDEKQSRKNLKADHKLRVAAQSGDANSLGGALAAGADIDAKTSEGWTAAMLAAARGQEACLRMLIQAGADIEAKSNNGHAAAIHAAYGGYPELAAWLDAVSLSRKERLEVRGASAPSHPSPAANRPKIRI